MGACVGLVVIALLVNYAFSSSLQCVGNPVCARLGGNCTDQGDGWGVTYLLLLFKLKRDNKGKG